MNGQTARSIMVNGKTTVCMEKESRRMWMDRNTQEVLNLTADMDLELLSNLMVQDTRENGKTRQRMVKESTSQQMETKLLVLRKMDSNVK